MSTVLIVVGVLVVLGGLAALAYWLWPPARDYGELARVKTEEQLAVWQVRALGRDAAEAMRRVAEEHRR